MFYQKKCSIKFSIKYLIKWKILENNPRLNFRFYNFPFSKILQKKYINVSMIYTIQGVTKKSIYFAESV